MKLFESDFFFKRMLEAKYTNVIAEIDPIALEYLIGMPLFSRKKYIAKSINNPATEITVNLIN